ncbi:MAG: phosphate ABC transporter permease PstA [Gammaproteobacteria bacterium]
MTEEPRLADRLLAGAVWLAAAAVIGVFLWLLTDLLREGANALSFRFLVDEPRDAGRAGGIAPILVSTLLILGVCLTVALPLSLCCAAYLAEYTRREDRAGRTVRVSLEVLAGMPSIVFGLFGNALFCITLGLGFSILSGGLTLACMALPLMIRATEEGFRAVPDDYRSGAAALGLSRWTTLTHILLPAALPGLIVGTVLGIGRALAETAALIFTSGYVDRWPDSLMDSGRALSIHIYDLAMNVPGGERNAYAVALVLIALLLVINLLASRAANRLLRRGYAVAAA